MIAFHAVALVCGATVNDRRQLSNTEILSYSPGSTVNDHARIDLDQAALEGYLSSGIPSDVGTIHSSGAHSKSTATVTYDGGKNVGIALSKGDKIYFETTGGAWVEGKATGTFAETATSISFTYPVDEAQVQFDYANKYATPSSVAYPCWNTPTTKHAKAKDGCAKVDGGGKVSIMAKGVGCTTGSSGGFNTCTGTTNSGGGVQTGTIVNQGKRTLKGFSTGAKSKMHSPCSSQPARGSTTYMVGCPYTSYEPYYDYYCGSGSPCNAAGDYASVIIESAIAGNDAAKTLTNNGMDFSGSAAGAGNDEALRKQIIKKGTAYMSAWMYAIREFEDAIDDCSVDDLTKNAGSSGAVHAWDEGVAFYVGSAMKPDDLYTGQLLKDLDGKGFLAYTLANKRCKNFKTCGPGGDELDGEAKVNKDLWDLFNRGNRDILLGKCADVVPIKNDIVKKMTVPLVQGTLRYAWKQATGPSSAKEQGEGAIFAAAVLPQVHACNPTHAATIERQMSANKNDGLDFNAVKAAFEACYPTMGVTCKDVGGLWDSSEKAYYTATGANGRNGGVPTGVYNAAPCVDPETAQSLLDRMKELEPGAIAGIVIGSVVGLFLLICIIVMWCKERKGQPIFAPLQGVTPSAPTSKVAA